MTGVLIQRGNVGTDMHTGKMPGEYEGHVKMHLGNVSTSPGKPHFASKPPEARGEAWNRFSPRTNSAHTMVWTLLASRAMR